MLDAESRKYIISSKSGPSGRGLPEPGLGNLLLHPTYSTGYAKTYQPLQLVEHYFQHLKIQNRQR